MAKRETRSLTPLTRALGEPRRGPPFRPQICRAVLEKAKTGEAFEHEGRKIQVTPPPLTPGGPKVSLGGGSVPAARRAGRFGLDLIAQRDDPRLRDAYLQAAEAAGVQPGNIMLPPKDIRSQIFVAEDVDAARS